MQCPNPATLRRSHTKPRHPIPDQLGQALKSPKIIRGPLGPLSHSTIPLLYTLPSRPVGPLQSL